MLTLDYETYSEAGYHIINGKWAPLLKNKTGISIVGAWNYSRHPSTEVLCAYWEYPNGVVETWAPGLPIPFRLFEYDGLIEAHNSFFEYGIWNNVCSVKYGWPTIPITRFRCSAAKSRNWGLPGSLGDISIARNLPIAKDSRGAELIRKISCPTGKLNKSESYQELLQEMHLYCYQDVKAEKCVSENTPEMSDFETSVWMADQHINLRGVCIDLHMVKKLQGVFEWLKKEYEKELHDITNGIVASVDEFKNIIEFLKTEGVYTDSVSKDNVTKLLSTLLPPKAYRVLEIRQLISGSAVKKLYSIEHQVDSKDNRLRGAYVYCGATQTGRFASYGVQLHNLKSGMGIDDIDSFFSDTENLTPHEVVQKHPDISDKIGASIRGLFIAGPGKDLIGTDFHAIEAVVIACLAREQWRIDTFRNGDDIYLASVSKLTGVPVSEMIEYANSTGSNHPLRKKGKVRELANGFGGWIGANRNFGADGTDEEIKRDILAWRNESPAIVEFWGGQWRKDPYWWEFSHEYYGLEGAFVLAMLNPKIMYHANPDKTIGYYYDPDVSVIYCVLPSGRRISYHYPKLVVGKNRLNKDLDEYKIYFKKWNTNPQHGPRGWITSQTYSGKLAENSTQAVAAEILKYSILNVEAVPYYDVVLHTHDEIISEVPESKSSIEEYESIVSQKAWWCQDWPISVGGGWRGKRYRKE
jgi:DNA polymerase